MDAIPESESTMSKSEPCDRIVKRVLQEEIDDAVENYLQRNPGIALGLAEPKAYEELRKDYRQALMTQYQDLVYLE